MLDKKLIFVVFVIRLKIRKMKNNMVILLEEFYLFWCVFFIFIFLNYEVLYIYIV